MYKSIYNLTHKRNAYGFVACTINNRNRVRLLIVSYYDC